jgi:hypothetical protein
MSKGHAASREGLVTCRASPQLRLYPDLLYHLGTCGEEPMVPDIKEGAWQERRILPFTAILHPLSWNTMNVAIPKNGYHITIIWRNIMGTWGSGNFDSDSALDFIGGEVRRHIREIDAIMADEVRFRLDEDAEAMLMPSVVMLSLLCEHCHSGLPRDLDADAWKARYLAMFDEQIGGLAPAPGFAEERRAIIAATFDHLRELHDRFWKRS